MLDNDRTEQSDPQEVENSADEPKDRVKKPRRSQRRPPAKKKPFITGLWPKIAIAAIVLCLGLAGFSIVMTANKNQTVPVIQNISVSDIAQTSAIINWQTNEPATSEVTICSSDNCTSLKLDQSMVTNHSATFTDIEPGTTYQLAIAARNERGKEARFVLELVTPRKPEVPIELGHEIGDRAPDFTLSTIDGKETSLSQYRGKIVMLNFWQSSCSACAQETPYIQAVFDEWPGDKLEILAVSVKERPVFVQTFLDTRGLTFPVLLDSDGTVSGTYQVSSFPTTFFINADGIIKAKKSGHFSSQSEIENMLKSL
ncbi:MAG: redoxin domain-containing protein [Dehalococcoidia bacterium]|nr:redoxin domain-containing protein [Dehalococcoidia bacterium]